MSIIERYKEYGIDVYELLQKNRDSREKGKPIRTFEEFLEEYNRYMRNEETDFSNVSWSVIVKHKNFTEDMVYSFQIHMQLFYRDYVETHECSDALLEDMYYNFVGHFNINWVKDENRRKRLFNV